MTTREGKTMMDCKHPSLQINEERVCCDCGECVTCGTLFDALRAIVRLMDGSQPKDYPGALMVARAAIRKAQEG